MRETLMKIRDFFKHRKKHLFRKKSQTAQFFPMLKNYTQKIEKNIEKKG
jgi:hypothetical protein